MTVPSGTGRLIYLAVAQIGARKFIRQVLHNNITMSSHENLSFPVLWQVLTEESAPRPVRVLWTR